MNVTVFQYLDHEYVNSLYETLRQQEVDSAAPEVTHPEADFSTVLSEATANITPVATESTQIEVTDASLEAIFQKASETYGVSANLLKAIAKAESCFHPYATSKSGAMGIMQLMPSTAAYLGVTDAYDAEQNIMGGAKLISELLAKYSGDVSLALAAYNAGSGSVDKYHGIPPFTETQNYVSKILGYLGGDVTVSVPNTASSSLSSLNEESREAVNDALELLFSKLDIQKSSLDALVDIINASKNTP